METPQNIHIMGKIFTGLKQNGNSTKYPHYVEKYSKYQKVSVLWWTSLASGTVGTCRLDSLVII
jgi:hypothetical protein